MDGLCKLRHSRPGAARTSSLARGRCYFGRDVIAPRDMADIMKKWNARRSRLELRVQKALTTLRFTWNRRNCSISRVIFEIQMRRPFVLIFFAIFCLAFAAAAASGYVFTNAFPGVGFTNPVCIVSAPAETNRLFILEKRGRVVVITNLAAPTRSLFMDITARVTNSF